MRYRHKHVIVDAFIWLGENSDLPVWFTDAVVSKDVILEPNVDNEELFTLSFKGNIHILSLSDFIIRGKDGSIYCSSADFFHSLYECVDNDETGLGGSRVVGDLGGIFKKGDIIKSKNKGFSKKSLYIVSKLDFVAGVDCVTTIVYCYELYSKCLYVFNADNCALHISIDSLLSGSISL